MSHSNQELEDEYNAKFGDPRRCSEHGFATSSPDGMFDAPCPACEGEMEDAYREELERERRAAMTQAQRDAEDAQGRKAIAFRKYMAVRSQALRSVWKDDTPF